jgi:hypothetical protein
MAIGHLKVVFFENQFYGATKIAVSSVVISKLQIT